MANANNEFSIEEKVFITSCLIAFERFPEASLRFREKYDKEPPPRTTVLHWKKVLLETGSLSHHKPRSGRPSDENVKQAVVDYIGANSTSSQRTTAQTVGTSKSTVNRVLSEKNIRARKFKMVQEISEDDPDRRLQFCNWIVNERRRSFHKSIIFSDEATFYLNSCVNKHNLFYYSEENEYRFLELPQKSAGLTVWAALSFDLGLTFEILDGQ